MFLNLKVSRLAGRDVPSCAHLDIMVVTLGKER